MTIETNVEQVKNALSPMDVTEFGIDNEV